MNIKENLGTIGQHIKEACSRTNRQADHVHVIAVTKYVSDETTRKAIEAGVEHIGENRAEAGLAKKEAIKEQATWHFIGSLQSRKVKQVIHEFDYFHSLDRVSLAKEFQKQSVDGETIQCFVQVNVSGEESKAGVQPDELLSFIRQLEAFPAVCIVGLMTMAPFTERPEETRPVFSGLRKLRDEVKALQLPYAPCTELSMGMSNDYVVAIEEGATFVRIGTALVGNEATSNK
ncbi:YggS family pyridoxal phosphate-dependent enzyme [Alkalihalobacillus sp. FSL W8-0930]